MALLPRRERWVPASWSAGWGIALPFYAAVVGVVVVIDRSTKPTTWEWIHSPKLLITLTVILAAATGLEGIRRVVEARRVRPPWKANKREIRDLLATLLVFMADTHGISATELGCGVFLTKEGSLRRPRWSGKFLRPLKLERTRAESLARVQRVRLPDDLRESPVTFTRGKGAVGVAWDTSNVHHNDWIGINDRYPDPASVDDHRWSQMNDQTKRGFTREEFVSLLGKYNEILAVPLIADGTVLGCVALDRRRDEERPNPAVPILNNQKSEKVLEAAARLMVKLLVPK